LQIIDFQLFTSPFSSNFLFELGMKEFEGIKDANVLFCARNQAFASLIPFDSFIPNSNEKLLPVSETAL
jgi:hypothetical protein